MRAVPGGRWGLTWLVVVVVVASVIARLELHARSLGYQPSVKDDAYGWAWERMRADGSPRTVAILGTSRIQLAFSAEAFHDVLPHWQSVQLAISGSRPLETLRDLAADPEFRGVAVVDAGESEFGATTPPGEGGELAAYHRRWRALGQMAERWLATRVQSHLAVLAVGGLRMVASLWRHGAWPAPRYVVTRADRTRYADYALADLAGLRRAQLARLGAAEVAHIDPEVWLADALLQDATVAQIQARGGQVVYVRMPTCDERWAIDERAMPKVTFWDRFAARTHAVAIHFKDDRRLADFACPDTSHLDSKDGPRFTRALLAILVERGVIAP
jgi:hypothetical protein